MASAAEARGRPSEGAREAVVEAARDLFMEREYDRVSTAEVLARSGVSRGALYHHFPSKRDLFLAVYEASERRVIQLVAAGTEGAATPFEALLAAARRYLELCEDDEEFRRIGLTQSRVVGDELTAAALVGAIGEVLVGPLSPTRPDLDEDALVADLVALCQRLEP